MLSLLCHHHRILYFPLCISSPRYFFFYPCSTLLLPLTVIRDWHKCNESQVWLPRSTRQFVDKTSWYPNWYVCRLRPCFSVCFGRRGSVYVLHCSTDWMDYCRNNTSPLNHRIHKSNNIAQSQYVDLHYTLPINLIQSIVLSKLFARNCGLASLAISFRQSRRISIDNIAPILTSRSS
jgi:hypothetical protein